MFKITPVAEGETDKAARRASRVSFSPGTALALGYRFQVGKDLADRSASAKAQTRTGGSASFQVHISGTDLAGRSASVQVQILDSDLTCMSA